MILYLLFEVVGQRGDQNCTKYTKCGCIISIQNTKLDFLTCLFSNKLKHWLFNLLFDHFQAFNFKHFIFYKCNIICRLKL